VVWNVLACADFGNLNMGSSAKLAGLFLFWWKTAREDEGKRKDAAYERE
jgi:hypothetical protein